jgi:GNAT superfamily N-acetyltransferase
LPGPEGLSVRELAQHEVADADRIFRVAFGTFLGVPDPEEFAGDADLVRTRWITDPGAALAAVLDGALVGSNFAANWGSVGFFGPLTVSPGFWDQGIAHCLLDETMALFERWGTRHVGLFTFAHSAKHVGLYQRHGFWPRFLTAVMSRDVELPVVREPFTLVSAVAEGELPGVLHEVRALTDEIYPGLDLTREIMSVRRQGLGDTVLVDDAAGLQALAVCHVGARTEAGSGSCYIKFGGVRPGPGAAPGFGRLVGSCHTLAYDREASVLVAGANAGRDRAWRDLVRRGFRHQFQGVAMHRPNEDGYSTSDRYIIDDWR